MLDKAKKLTVEFSVFRATFNWCEAELTNFIIMQILYASWKYSKLS